ncbi:MAG: DNA polymerase III subunit gamma [Candidatus Westeberhardia cardiocondylae]|nr:DNA polymerase III subunit gamma [Candidatus Westeberhardia cardiocondylae]
MSYFTVLSRKWRPKTFDDIVGQINVVKALKNSFSLNRFHHAYLFSGMHGVGKTSIARLMGKSLNCSKGVTISPCGVCDNCLQIEKGNFVDFIEIDAASRSKVEDVRELLENVQYIPIHGRFKIYLIDEVHMLSRYSFNALLKVLEEPPEYVKFFLVTTDLHKIPITVVSRCLLFYFQSLLVDQIQDKLKLILLNEKINFEDSALHFLSNESQGSMRDALSLVDQAIVLGKGFINERIVHCMFCFIDKNYSLSLIESLVFLDTKGIVLNLEKYSNLGLNWENLLVDMILLLYRISCIQLSYNKFFDSSYFKESDIFSRLKKLSSYIDKKDLQFYYKVLLKARRDLPYAPSYQICVEMSLFKILTYHINK